MTEPRDECRPVTLPSGEVIRVRGHGGLGPAGVAALGELVDAVRRIAAENPPDEGAPELFERIEAARGARTLRECAALAGVRFSTLFRVGQGRMPGGSDLALIGAWLQSAEPCQCCVFGNHAEPCTCDGSACCHPQIHREGGGDV